MGLDMYLTAKFYPWLLNTDTQAIMYPKLQEIIKMVLPSDDFTVSCIKVELASWRKANAIHKWFVDNLNRGVDNCEEIFIPQDELNNLLNLCLEVQQYPADAPKLLPTMEGFFFGSTEYDDRYFDNIERTIGVLREAKKIKLDIYYQASW